MRPYLSLIIPYYNAQATIGRLLDSVKHSKGAPPLEVIVVDDGSSNNFKFQISNFKLKSKAGTLRAIYLPKNRGPAAARNRGAKVARGKFLLFLDSDVELFPDALHNLTKLFQDDPDVVAATGVWVRQQRTSAFFPNFKALRDWSYWINERDVGGYYFLFSTRIAAIKKTVFNRLGGFDESYLAALVEDIEFTYRIARRYAIIFAPNVRVHHQFESFWPIARKYFWRSFHWTKLFSQRKKFDPVATTSREAAAAVSGASLVFLGLISLAVYLFLPRLLNCSAITLLGTPVCLAWVFSYLLIANLFLHLFLVRKFLLFASREKGIVFACKSFITGLALYCFIFTGALWAKLK